MQECWPLVLSCLFAGGLSAGARLALADLLLVLRQLGVDGAMLAWAGWPVAGYLLWRLRLERAARRPVAFADGRDGRPADATEAGARSCPRAG